MGVHPRLEKPASAAIVTKNSAEPSLFDIVLRAHPLARSPQRHTPHCRQNRHNCIPIGYGLAGWATDKFGAPLVFLIGSGVTALVSLLIFRAYPGVQNMD